MDEQKRLELQAWLDGEVSPSDSARWERLLASDPEAGALAAELRAGNRALLLFEQETRVPVSRDFYWSGIRKQIESAGHRSRRAVAPTVDWVERLRQYLVPASVAAAFMIAGMLATHQVRSSGGQPVAMEASLSSPGTFTYRDFDSGVTLVWLSYPAEKEFAEIDSILRIP